MNLFLVEDEHWALAELAELFKRYEPEHRVYAFDSGRDALKAARETEPHLVLTDINMPEIDGLELIRELSAMYPAVKGIVLSVHDRFAYAQTGMRLGVADYLLKPVRKETLFSTVDRAIERIRADSRLREERLQSSLLRLLLSPGDDDGETDVRAKAAVSGGCCAVLLLHGNRASSGGWHETPLGGCGIKRCLAGSEQEQRDIHCIAVDAKRKVLLMPADPASLPAVRLRLLALFNSIVELGIQVQLAYAYKREKAGLNETFELLGKRIGDYMHFARSTFISPELGTSSSSMTAIWDKVRLLQTFLKEGDMVRGSEAVSKVVYELRRRDVTLKELAVFVRDLLYSLKFNLQSGAFGADFPNHGQEELRELEEMTSYEQLEQWLTSRMFQWIGRPDASAPCKPKGLIPVLMSRIHASYEQNLSLQQFAAEFHVSLGYLSRLFKAQIGCNFSDYLTRYRIARAKELLAEGPARPADIGELVGYEDAKHFALLFKKLVGETPAMYAKRNRNEK